LLHPTTRRASSNSVSAYWLGLIMASMFSWPATLLETF
jgi:hypothetical protein